MQRKNKLKPITEYEFIKCVKRYKGDRHAIKFNCRDQFLEISFDTQRRCNYVTKIAKKLFVGRRIRSLALQSNKATYTFYLLMRIISCYTVYTEKQQSEGRVDCIVETPDYIYIFEFKLDGTADEALAQIEDKGYARPYEADNRPLYKIGVSFSSETGTVSDWKVR